MPIINFAFDKVLAENKSTKDKKVAKVETRVTVDDIKEEKAGIEVKDKLVRLDFMFELVYDPNVASIALGGHVDYVGPAKEVKKMLNDWTKDKQSMDFEIIKNILNLVLVRSNIKALELSQEIGLPPHMPMPLMTKQLDKQDPQKYIG